MLHSSNGCVRSTRGGRVRSTQAHVPPTTVTCLGGISVEPSCHHVERESPPLQRCDMVAWILLSCRFASQKRETFKRRRGFKNRRLSQGVATTTTMALSNIKRHGRCWQSFFNPLTLNPLTFNPLPSGGPCRRLFKSKEG